MKVVLKLLSTLLAIVVFYGGIMFIGHMIPSGTDQPNNGESFDAISEYGREYLFDEQSEQSAEEAGAIGWSEAEGYIGEYVTVYGTVKEVSQPGASGDPIFVDIGNAYPGDRVTGVCWSEYHSAFDDLFQYEGEAVFMEGTLYLHNGTPNIELTDSFQIREAN